MKYTNLGADKHLIETVCPYCHKAFCDSEKTSVKYIGSDILGNHRLLDTTCPSCNKIIIYLYSDLTLGELVDSEILKEVELYYKHTANFERAINGTYAYFIQYKQIKPDMSLRRSIPEEVDNPEIINDYNEACQTLNISLRASATLSRRCLQNILESKTQTIKKQLSGQIDDLIAAGTLKSEISELLHAVKEIGNLSAHPIKYLDTDEIAEISRDEAELNLEVIEALFDYFYVIPAKNEIRKNNLNEKLARANRKNV